MIVGVFITLLTVACIGGGVYAFASAPSETATPDQTETPTPTPQPTVNEAQAPTPVQETMPAAKELKANLTNDGYENASVSITRDGEIIVSYSSDARNGPELKEDMGEVAIRYSAVVDNSTGGLTVAANGVKLMVSSDAAAAHDRGKLNTDAFKETFHWGTIEQQAETEGSQ